jgi:YidC/Oxa1 family membrane protein insertase
MEKRALLALVLSLVVLVAYQEIFLRRLNEPSSTAPQQPNEISAPEANEVQEKPIDFRPAVQTRDGKTVIIQTPLYIAKLTSKGGVFTSFKLIHHRDDLSSASGMLNLIDEKKQVGPVLAILRDNQRFEDHVVDYSIEGLGSSESIVTVKTNEEKKIAFVQEFEGGLVRKTFVFRGGDYTVGLRISVEGEGFLSKPIAVSFFWKTALDPHKNALQGVEEEVAFHLSGKVQRKSIDDVTKGINVEGDVGWVAVSGKHFLSAMAFTDGKGKKLVTRSDGSSITVEVDVPVAREAGAFHVGASVFLGPKEVSRLKKLGVGLEKAVDFGWFWFVAIPLLQCLHLFHQLTNNYGIDIILLTLIIKVAFIPLTHKSFSSMKQMQRLQPQMVKIREKFKNDREKLNKEVMELYKRNKVNPFGGCLPMLLQLPVFVGLYNALLGAVELRHARFAFWIDDLSAPDRLLIAGVGIPVLTILMGGSMLLQQWMTPAAGDPNQRIMMLILPVVFTFMFINFPAGLVLYWLVNNILSIGQQYLVNRSG